MNQKIAALLSDFLVADAGVDQYLQITVSELNLVHGYHLAWNPRLMRPNPHAVRRRDLLVKLLS